MLPPSSCFILRDAERRRDVLFAAFAISPLSCRLIAAFIADGDAAAAAAS